MRRRIIATLVIAGIAALALTACGGKKEEAPVQSSEPAPTVAPAASGTENPDMILGGWQLNDDDTIGWATEEATAAFEKATTELTGADYQIVAQLGQQVVSGMNYMFLCKETMVTANPVTKLSIVTIYADLEGNAKIANVEDLDLGMFYGAEDSEVSEALLGGWSIPNGFQAVNLPDPASTAYDQALGDESGYYPMALLGSQLVNGTNYAFLCFDESAPCLVYIYAPLEGDAELANVYHINLGEYSGR